MMTTTHGTDTLKPPLSNHAASAACKLAADAWNSGSTTQILKLFAHNGEWHNRHLHVIGKSNIANYLSNRNVLGLHYNTQLELWNHSASRLSLRFKSEWQHGKNGQWYRSNGCALTELSSHGLIHNLYLHSHDTLINANDRFIGLARG